MRSLPVLLGVLALTGITSVLYSADALDVFGMHPLEGEEDGLRVGSLAIAAGSMLAGILFGTLHGRLVGREQVDVLAELKRLPSDARLVRALLVAPMVFVAVYGGTEAQPEGVLAALFAFENGFFCEALFARTHGQADS